jgi:hypothetical protein
MDQSITTGDIVAKIAIYDEKIKTEKENIETARRALKQLDEGVDQVLGRSTSETGASRAVDLRRSQQKERSRLQNEVLQSQKSIAELNEARAPGAAEARKVEAEVGPLKYIAALLYTEQTVDVLEKAVRLIIIALIIVFDPLAILLMIAANMSFRDLQTTSVTAASPPVIEPVAPSGVMDIPKEFPDVFASQHTYPQDVEKQVATQTPKPKETWSEVLYRRAGLTGKTRNA